MYGTAGEWRCYVNVMIVCNSAPHVIEVEHMYGYSMKILVPRGRGQ